MVDIGVAITTLKTVVGVVRDAGKIDLTHQVIMNRPGFDAGSNS